MNINIIKQSIKKWNEIRHTQLGLKFLTSGSGFEIKRSEYNKWEEIKNNTTEKEEKTYVHLYIGVLEFETVFYLIDSISDKKKDYRVDETLFYKNFTKENIEKESEKNEGIKEVVIEDTEAAARAFKWFFSSNEWAHKKLKESPKNDESGIVRVFTIPFQDFENIFEDKANNKAYFFFGIKKMEIKKKKENEIEVILCSEKGFLHKKSSSNKKSLGEAEDVTTPRPPYSIEGYGLNLL